MTRRIAFAVAFAFASIGWTALAVEKDEEDPALPRPAKGKPANYYSSLAKVHATYRLYAMAEKLQLKAIEVEADRAKKEMLSFELFDRIYFRAKWWDKAAKEILYHPSPEWR